MLWLFLEHSLMAWTCVGVAWTCLLCLAWDTWVVPWALAVHSSCRVTAVPHRVPSSASNVARKARVPCLDGTAAHVVAAAAVAVAACRGLGALAAWFRSHLPMHFDRGPRPARSDSRFRTGWVHSPRSFCFPRCTTSTPRQLLLLVPSRPTSTPPPPRTFPSLLRSRLRLLWTWTRPGTPPARRKAAPARLHACVRASLRSTSRATRASVVDSIGLAATQRAHPPPLQGPKGPCQEEQGGRGRNCGPCWRGGEGEGHRGVVGDKRGGASHMAWDGSVDPWSGMEVVTCVEWKEGERWTPPVHPSEANWGSKNRRRGCACRIWNGAVGSRSHKQNGEILQPSRI